MSAPTSLPPPSNASRAWLKALHALSPTSLFAVKKQLLNESMATPEAREPLPQIPAFVIETLGQMVDFLEENHRREEGLYRRDGIAHEIEKLRRTCLNLEEPEALPNLAGFSPHSIAGVIKEILGREFEPLIPYDLSQVLVERVAEQDEVFVLGVLVDKFKHILPQNREFLKVFLIHLQHISTSIPCKMNANSLAENVGILFVRPTEEKNLLLAKDLRKRRRRIAQLLIENATALPYENAIDFVIPDVSETTDVCEINERTTKSCIKTHDCENYCVQIIWDPDTNPHSEESLQEQLSDYGDIVTLAINASSNRALVGFRHEASVLTVVNARIPGLKIRRRNPRGARSDSNASMNSNRGSIAKRPTFDTMLEVNKLDVGTSPSDHIQSGSHQKVMTTLEAQQSRFDNISSPLTSAAPDSPKPSSPTFLHKLQRPPSILLEQKVMRQAAQDEDIALEDIESRPNSPADHEVSTSQRCLSLDPITETVDDETSCGDAIKKDACPTTEKISAKDETMDMLLANELARTTTSAKELENKEGHLSQRRKSWKELLRVDVMSTTRRQNPDTDGIQTETNLASVKLVTLSPSQSLKLSLMKGFKSKFSKVKVSTPRAEERINEKLGNTIAAESSSNLDICHNPIHAKPTRSQKTQTTSLPIPTHDQGTNTDNVLSQENVGDESRENRRQDESEQLERVLEFLRKIQMELGHLKSAISASQRTDIDQAILSAHEKLLQWIDEAIGSTCSNFEGDEPTPTFEFVSFIESRSKTQVRILEAELRAGQELLRLHKTQHQKEIDEFESQVASLRVANKEAERMCAELRSDLRKVKNELNCSIAAAASIKREKREAEERLVITENKLRAKEIETQELEASHAEMQEIAANAQARLDKHRASAPLPFKDSCGDKYSLEGTSLRMSACPNAFFFLDRQDHVKSAHPEQHGPGLYKNTDELRQMKARLQEQIDSQIKVTKAKLNEMRDFGSVQRCHREEDLEQLQQELESACADMNAAMDESRRKLDELDNPAFSRDGVVSPSAPRIHPSTIVNSLLERALSLDSLDSHTPQDELKQRTSQSGIGECPPSAGLEILQHWRVSECDVKSEMYKRWLQQRQVRASAVQGGKHGRNTSIAKGSILREAQESMQRFQDTLESVATPARR